MSSINRQWNPGARFLVNADVIEPGTVQRSRTKRLDVVTDHGPDCAGQVSGEVLRFGYEGVAGGHSDRRKSSSSSSVRAASSSALSM